MESEANFMYRIAIWVLEKFFNLKFLGESICEVKCKDDKTSPFYIMPPIFEFVRATIFIFVLLVLESIMLVFLSKCGVPLSVGNLGEIATELITPCAILIGFGVTSTTLVGNYVKNKDLLGTMFISTLLIANAIIYLLILLFISLSEQSVINGGMASALVFLVGCLQGIFVVGSKRMRQIISDELKWRAFRFSIIIPAFLFVFGIVSIGYPLFLYLFLFASINYLLVALISISTALFSAACKERAGGLIMDEVLEGKGNTKTKSNFLKEWKLVRSNDEELKYGDDEKELQWGTSSVICEDIRILRENIYKFIISAFQYYDSYNEYYEKNPKERKKVKKLRIGYITTDKPKGEIIKDIIKEMEKKKETRKLVSYIKDVQFIDCFSKFAGFGEFLGQEKAKKLSEINKELKKVNKELKKSKLDENKKDTLEQQKINLEKNKVTIENDWSLKADPEDMFELHYKIREFHKKMKDDESRTKNTITGAIDNEIKSTDTKLERLSDQALKTLEKEKLEALKKYKSSIEQEHPYRVIIIYDSLSTLINVAPEEDILRFFNHITRRRKCRVLAGEKSIVICLVDKNSIKNDTKRFATLHKIISYMDYPLKGCLQGPEEEKWFYMI